MIEQQGIESAAILCARRMIEYCDGAKHYGHYTGYTNGEEALQGVASGAFGFGDLCDDNIFMHEVLSGMGLIPVDIEECMDSWDATAIWNRVVNQLDWAAEQVLKERIAANPALRAEWEFTCECGLPLRADDAYTDHGHIHCSNCHERETKAGTPNA